MKSKLREGRKPSRQKKEKPGRASPFILVLGRRCFLAEDNAAQVRPLKSLELKLQSELEIALGVPTAVSRVRDDPRMGIRASRIPDK